MEGVELSHSRGTLVVVEGLDKAGKSTQCARLVKNLENLGKPVRHLRFPGCVYSAAKEVEGIDLEWARWPDVGLPRPDICIFLDISPSDAAKRGNFGVEKYETTEMQDRVRKLFGDIRGSVDKEDFFVIDAGKSEREVEERILQAVRDRSEQLRMTGGPQELRSVLPMRPES
ncbi:MAG: Thymidylate kinase [Sclerophora amabilis]|nr:MAG: Thymidylate kinase [Sclerophora amabilis]